MKKLIVVVLIACIALVTYMFTSTEQRLLFTLNPINHPDVLQVERMIDRTGAAVPAETKKKVALAIAEHARYYGIKPKNLVAIAFVESNFKPTLINETGDHGLMQINWPTWKNRFTRDPKDLLNVYKNVEVACKIININRSMGHDELAAYHSFNDEPKAVYAAKLKEVLRRL